MAVPPDFVSGQVLTAAQMNQIGMWEIKTQTIGTGVASVTVTDVFSADYDVYDIMVVGGSASALSTARVTFGSTATGYYWGWWGWTYASAQVGQGAANATSFSYLVNAGANGIIGNFRVFNPFTAQVTTVAGVAPQLNTLEFGGGCAGFLNNTTSYTAFTITPGSGTFTGGTIRVYGYRK